MGRQEKDKEQMTNERGRITT